MIGLLYIYMRFMTINDGLQFELLKGLLIVYRIYLIRPPSAGLCQVMEYILPPGLFRSQRFSRLPRCFK
eukprot:COSAG01_NODE_1283_length_10920_cov_5.539507_6_plen_69_part_00